MTSNTNYYAETHTFGSRNTSDQVILKPLDGKSLILDGTALLSGSSLSHGRFLLGQVDNTALEVQLSADATLAATGAMTLANTTVTPGSYTLSGITVNSKGLITSASTTTISGDATVGGTGILTIADTTVAASTYAIPTSITVNSQGRLTNASKTLTSANIILGSGANIATSTAVTGDITIDNIGVTTLATVNAGVGTFGSSTNIPVITANAKGLITAISNTSIGSALTKTDDTNVTLTLGGTPSTALLQASSITAGWTGTLSGDRGGTGVNNSSKTITLGGNLTTSGAFDTTLTSTATTSVTLPTTGTLFSSGVQSLAIAGSSSAPSYSFSSSSSTGMYSFSTGLINLVCGGTAMVGMNSSTGVNFSQTTDSTSITTGAIRTGGGLGVAKNLYVGVKINTPLINVVQTGTSTSTAIDFTNGNGVIGSISMSGSTTTYNTTSDRRLKEHIKPNNGCLDIINRINIVDYKWKDSETKATGLIAQEINEIIPEICSMVDEDYNNEKESTERMWHSVNYQGLIPYLIKSIQELHKEIEDMKEEMKTFV